MKILIACEFSGIVREAFRLRGHDAWSCDLLPTEIPGQHIQDDVLNHLNGGWDMMIAHPPCTFICNSGVRWLNSMSTNQKYLDRWYNMEIASDFFKHLLSTNISKIAIENPIPHKYALKIIGKKYNQIIQPWQFGHGETKSTCLWLKGLPKLHPSDIVPGRVGRVHHEPPGKDRWKNRSRTYLGIAEAMAEQWG